MATEPDSTSPTAVTEPREVAVFEEYRAEQEARTFMQRKQKRKITDTLAQIHGVLEPAYFDQLYGKINTARSPSPKRQTPKRRAVDPIK